MKLFALSVIARDIYKKKVTYLLTDYIPVFLSTWLGGRYIFCTWTTIGKKTSMLLT